MYKGPFYYHQPGTNQHTRTVDLMKQGIGDGVIIPVKTIRKSSDKTFSQFVQDSHATQKAVLFDVEYYDPLDFSQGTSQEGSRILNSPNMRGEYISTGLKLQHELNTSAYIIPNFETESVSPTWYQSLDGLCIDSCEWIASRGNVGLPKYLTIAIPASYLINQSNRALLLNKLTTLKNYIDGFYITIIGIPETLNDALLFRGLLELVFRLKWQQFDVVFGKVGAWVLTLFPLGLDTFGNGGFKSDQVARSRRQSPKKGGGPVKYDNVWSDDSMSYIRFPDDAAQMHNQFSLDEKKQIYGERYGFAPPVDRNPEDVYRSKGYGQRPRLNSFSASMAGMAKDFRGLSLNERIAAVDTKLKKAINLESKIGKVLTTENRGREKQIWLDGLHQYLNEVRDDIEEFFDE